MIEINGHGLQFMKIYIGIGGFEFGSGVTTSPGLVLLDGLALLLKDPQPSFII